MNIKISDFAGRYGVSDRHARRLLAEHETELCGHYTRNTKGTWIDEFAAEFLRDLLRNPMEILPAEPMVSIEDLQLEIEKLKDDRLKLAVALADAEKRAGANAGAAALLEAAENREKALHDKNEKLIRENADLEKRAIEARKKEIETQGALDKAVDQAKANAELAEANGQEAEKAKAETAEIKAKYEKLKNRNVFQRIWNKE